MCCPVKGSRCTLRSSLPSRRSFHSLKQCRGRALGSERKVAFVNKCRGLVSRGGKRGEIHLAHSQAGVCPVKAPHRLHLPRIPYLELAGEILYGLVRHIVNEVERVSLVQDKPDIELAKKRGQLVVWHPCRIHGDVGCAKRVDPFPDGGLDIVAAHMQRDGIPSLRRPETDLADEGVIERRRTDVYQSNLPG